MATIFSQDASTPSVPFDSYTPRVAIVTGAAQGIGYAIAQRLAEDGIDVAINDIADKQKQIDSVVQEILKKGRRAISIPGDVSSETEVISMIEKTSSELGGVDIMVANAGIGAIAAFTETTGEMFDGIYSVNVRGVFFCFKQAALQMIKQGRGGRLIAASSSAGKQGTPNPAAYSAAKFAVRGLTQTASIELRRHGITASTHLDIFGHRQASILQSVVGPDGVDENCARIKKLFGAPDAPVSDADTVSSIVSYLAKPEAYFVNGQSINVDGGLRYD